MRQWLLILIFTTQLIALQTSDKLFDCTKIFEERKAELLVELERIDEQKQALDALKSATDELLNKKAAMLDKRESEVDEKLENIKEKEKNIKQMLEADQKVLEEIKAVRMDKITRTYAKMKPGASAKILGDLETSEAAAILGALKPATAGKILAKMSSDKAAQITRFLTEENR